MLDLVARWVHVVAAIMWAGNSMLFVWLDRSLRRADHPTRTRDPSGTIWLLHSGGFYYVEKTLLAGEPLPRPLHWFKWQAYTTWLSGVALLLVVYYLSDRAVLADPAVAPLTHAAAAAVGAGAIALGWALYELVQRAVAPRAPVAAAVAWLGGLAAIVAASAGRHGRHVNRRFSAWRTAAPAATTRSSSSQLHRCAYTVGKWLLTISATTGNVM